MGCTVYKTRRMTRREAVVILGSGYACPHRHGDAEDCDNELISVEGETRFMCGDGKPEPLCPCWHLADILCDYPVGRGKTCDLPLCPDCAHSIGEDRDLCPIHFAEFSGKAEPARVFGKGPRLVK